MSSTETGSANITIMDSGTSQQSRFRRSTRTSSKGGEISTSPGVYVDAGGDRNGAQRDPGSDAHPAMTPIGAVFEQLAATAPDRVAITFGTQTLTRVELEKRTSRLARAYEQLGVTPGSLVTIALPNGIEFIEAAIAVWKIGATPQLVSHRLPAREQESIIKLVEPSLVVGIDSVDGFVSVPAGYAPSATLSDDPFECRVPPSFKAPASGGSSGTPKVIVATDPGPAESVRAYGAVMGIRPEHTVLLTAPLYHNGPFVCAAIALVEGCHIVIMRRFDATEALALIERHQVNWMYSVPTMLHRFAKLSRWSTRSGRHLNTGNRYHVGVPLFSGGAGLLSEVARSVAYPGGLRCDGSSGPHGHRRLRLDRPPGFGRPADRRRDRDPGRGRRRATRRPGRKDLDATRRAPQRPLSLHRRHAGDRR